MSQWKRMMEQAEPQPTEKETVTETTAKEKNKFRGLFGHKKLSVEGGPDIVAWFGGGRSGAVFSTFYPAPFLDDDGIQYPSVEAYYQYQKAKAFDADDLAERILWAYSPSYQRRLGQSIPNFDAAKWDTVADAVMRRGLKYKFTQNPELAEKLVGTGSAVLCEATDAECVWSAGLALNDPKLLDRKAWAGASRLGDLLMGLREELASDG